MSYEIKEERKYEQGAETVLDAALGAVSGLEGKVVKQEQNRIEAKFDKKILGKVLGDRTQLEVDLSAGDNGQTTIAVTIYPIDAVGRKLMFGARKGVSTTVLGWYWAHLEHRLK
jgi:hypothetical protein